MFINCIIIVKLFKIYIYSLRIIIYILFKQRGTTDELIRETPDKDDETIEATKLAVVEVLELPAGREK